jgi:serine/threonine-protein kinase HipA
MVGTLKTWREHFRACGVSAKDIDHIASAFLPECFFLDKPPQG